MALIELVKLQPKGTVFFKVFLELGMKHMLEYLSFDQATMAELLSEKNSSEFNSDFPLFYKDKDGQSALDTALDNNLLQVVETMVEYICEH